MSTPDERGGLARTGGNGPETPGQNPAGVPVADPWSELAATLPAPPAGEPAPAPAPATRNAEQPAHPQAGEPNPAPTSLDFRKPVPTLDDLLATRPPPAVGPATMGWQVKVRRLTGGLIRPRPGRFETRHRHAVAAVQRSLNGPKTIVVVNPKGGAHKTTATFMLAATFGIHRGGYSLAWDNNETRGTLGWRALQARHTNTAVDLLDDLERFRTSRAMVGDLDNFVRAQGQAQFDVLASDEDAASAASIDDLAFNNLHRALSRFYRILVIDTGNNMRASNYRAAIEVADQLVIVSTVRDDTANSAAWLADALAVQGYADKVRQAVTVLSAPSSEPDKALHDRLHDHFSRVTRTVVDVPHDPSLVAGDPIDINALSDPFREAWLMAAAEVADGL